MAEPVTKPAKDGTRRGGARAGAGRKSKAARSPTAVSDIDLRAALAEAPPAEIDVYLRGQSHRWLDNLVKIMIHGDSDPARIAAAEKILDRGYGKPGVDIGGDSAQAILPFQSAPKMPSAEEASIRKAAQLHAPQAVMVLKLIAERSLSQTARVAANDALLKRAEGTVGVARILFSDEDQKIGKKQQAQRAAEAAASGLYAPPPPPRMN